MPVSSAWGMRWLGKRIMVRTSDEIFFSFIVPQQKEKSRENSAKI
jgi:hypothetical protein